MKMTPVFSYRLMEDQDIAAVLRIQAENYPAGLQEGAAIVASRLACARDTTWVALEGEAVCAYLFSYLSDPGSITPLGAPFRVSGKANTLYLHDLAVARQARGHGIGGALVGIAHGTARGRGLLHSALVAVQESIAFWRQFGYDVAHELSSLQAEALRTYPQASRYMVKSLGGALKHVA